MAQSAPQLSRPARVRIGAVLTAADPHTSSSPWSGSDTDILFGPVPPLGEAVTTIVRQEKGFELEIDQEDLSAYAVQAPVVELQLVVLASYVYLRDLAQGGRPLRVGPQEFENAVNRILASDGFPSYLAVGRWRQRIESDLEALRRALLANPADVAACQQGDPQVEMVVSTVQTALSRPDPVLVDYGAGLGRVLAGLGTAERFRQATYVAVDEPVAKDVQNLGRIVGARFVARTRTDFLNTPDAADAIMLVNTLHHIPFCDLSRQVGALLRALKPGGVLVVQEIGELREPEQFNVPWRIEDIIALFAAPGCTTNPRSTMTRTRKVPLTHMLVHVEGEPPTDDVLAEKARSIWASMKARVLDDIRRLYASGDPNDQVELHHALFTNANLDLNKPK